MIYEQLGDYIKNRIEVSDESLNTILSYFNPLKQGKNDILLSAGQNGQNTYFVGKGCLRIYYINLLVLLTYAFSKYEQ